MGEQEAALTAAMMTAAGAAERGMGMGGMDGMAGADGDAVYAKELHLGGECPRRLAFCCPSD